MAVSVPRKKSKKSKEKVEERGFLDSYFLKLLGRIPAAFILLLIIFLWSSTTTIISGSVVHVCVTSRKLNNLYCLSAGAQPATGYDIPLPVTNSSSEVSAAEGSPKVVHSVTHTQQVPSTGTKFTLNVTQNPIFHHNSPLAAADKSNTTITSAEEHTIAAPSTDAKSNLNYAQKSAVSSPNSPSIATSNTKDSASGVTKNTTVFSPVKPSITASVIKHSIDIQLPVNSNSSETQVSDGNTIEVLHSSFPPSASLFTNPVLMRNIDKAKAEEIANARKDVEGQLAVLRSYVAKSKPSDCDGRGIYVYDLPAKFNKDLLAKCHDMITWVDYCRYFTNDMMGEPITELGKGWYNTDQYALEPIFHSHVLNHPCRNHNAEDAKLFYVPFYGGLDVLRWHFKTTVSNSVKDALSNELIEWLKLQKSWKRNFGLDHVFVLGKISWDFRRADNGTWGTSLLELDELQNPMKLLIERQPWHLNDVGIPHPTYFHPSSDEDIIAWQRKIREVNRKHLISFAGSPRKASESIRSILIDQCNSAPNSCKFFDCRRQACVNPAPLVKLFMESEFCLQPPGDSPTRKSLFDSLITGCIPVVFDPFTAHYQYPWHLPEDHRKYSVFIDKEEVRMSLVNVVERLVKIPLKERQEMRKYIIDELMPRLVYSDPKAKLKKFDDAVTIAVNNLLERAVNKLP